MNTISLFTQPCARAILCLVYCCARLPANAVTRSHTVGYGGLLGGGEKGLGGWGRQ